MGLIRLSRAARIVASAIAVVLALAAPGPVRAESQFVITIKDHRFEPPELTVPAGQRITLVIDNQDPTPEEFESHELKREKIIPGGSKASIPVGPLKAGTYPFFGEFNEATARGKLIAK